MQREMTRMQTELAITQRELNRKKEAAPHLSGATLSSAALPAAVIPRTDGGGEDTGEAQTDYETLRKRYDSLLTRQSQLDRGQVSTAGLDPGVFQLVDMPAQPRMPVGPNRFKYRMISVALALAVALLVAFALEIPKLYSINDQRDVEYYLGVPVIALIPETVTPPESGSRRQLVGRAVGMILAALLVSAVLIFMSYREAFTHVAALLR
jgi:hypothetical protein